MIDFRYHLISIIAVLLALAIGIFAGSGFLGGPLLDDLENRVEGLEQRNKEVRARNVDLGNELDQAHDFTRATEPLLVGGSLADDRVVIIEFEGGDAAMVEGLMETVEQAGGIPVSRILLRNKLALETDTDLEQLALIVGSADARPREVRHEAAVVMGGALAAAGSFAGGEPRGVTSAMERLRDLFDQLDRAGFLSVDQLDGDDPVPPGTSFIVAGGSAEPAPYEVAQFAADLGRIISSDAGNPVIAAEPAVSVWGISTGIRDDQAASQRVATCDQADTLEGRIATVLGLAAMRRGEVGHFGVGPGATALVPTPPPGG